MQLEKWVLIVNAEKNGFTEYLANPLAKICLHKGCCE